MPESKKVVIKADIHDAKCKRKALKAVSGLSGIESLAMDDKDKKLTIVGGIDPVDVVGKLKKWNPQIVTVGPAKEEKKDGDKKDGDKKDGDKKDGDKKDDDKKKKEEEEFRKWWENHRAYYYNPCVPHQYYVQEEYPTSSCVIS